MHLLVSVSCRTMHRSKKSSSASDPSTFASAKNPSVRRSARLESLQGKENLVHDRNTNSNCVESNAPRRSSRIHRRAAAVVPPTTTGTTTSSDENSGKTMSVKPTTCTNTVTTSRRRSTRSCATRRKSKHHSQEDSLLHLPQVKTPKAKRGRRKRSRARTTAVVEANNPRPAKKRKTKVSRVSESSKRTKADVSAKESARQDVFALSGGIIDTTEVMTAPIDQRNKGDVLAVPEYASQIFQYYYAIEVSALVSPSGFSAQ